MNVRIVLFPFALMYGIVVYIRNMCYDLGILKSFSIPKKSICVGNLSVGGTGKTPLVAYIAQLLIENNQPTSILSRGYGRKTKGFRWVKKEDNADLCGDEPLIYANRFESVNVAVCEKRKDGIQVIQKEFPSNEVILLDDAFQHRAVKAGFSILVTDYKHPFSSDYLLPVGNLRESKNGRNRADIIVVSKCPKNLSEQEKSALTKQLKFNPKSVFFSQIHYENPICFGTPIQSVEKYVLVTGIANPKPLIEQIGIEKIVEHIEFPDHYAFTANDIQQIHQKFDTFADGKTILLTTEKDFMRLRNYLSEWKLHSYPWYFQPISVVIDREIEFKNLITTYVGKI